MSSHNHHYRDNDFNPEQSAGYTLLIQVGVSSFSYAVTGLNKLLVLEENISINELTQPSEEHSLLSVAYKQRIVGLPQTGFTFIPASLFQAEQVADFARFLDVKPVDKVFSQSLDADNQVIFKVDESMVNYGHTVFAAKGWIKAISAVNLSNNNLYLNISGDKVELLYFKDRKLRFYNCFEFKTADELAYFTTFVVGELQLQPQDLTLCLSGDVSISDQNIHRLATFFGKIESNNLEVVELPAQIAAHEVLMLTALSLCGSSEVR